jgi:hypothetical protein
VQEVQEAEQQKVQVGLERGLEMMKSYYLRHKCLKLPADSLRVLKVLKCILGQHLGRHLGRQKEEEELWAVKNQKLAVKNTNIKTLKNQKDY